MRTKKIILAGIVTAAITAASGSGLLFLKFLNAYFPNLSENFVATVCVLVMGCVLILTTEGLYGWIFRDLRHQAAKTTMVIQNMNDKIYELELKIVNLKNEQTILKALPQKFVPNQKLNIITHERGFLHELANKVQIIQGSAESLVELTADLEQKKSKEIFKQLEIMTSNAEKMASLIKENRDYLIIAA